MCVAPAPHHTCAYFCIETCTRLHSQDGRLPLHYAAAKQASEAVVVALLAAHPGAAKEQNRVRQPCPYTSHATFLLSSHCLARRLGGCRCTRPRQLGRRKQWCGRCWLHTQALPRRRTTCARCACVTLRTTRAFACASTLTHLLL